MKYISIILPLYGLNKYLNSNQFKYNYYWRLGTPIHITFIFNITLENYNKNRNDVLKTLNEMLNLIKNIPLQIEKLKKLDKMIYLEPNQHFIYILKELHNLFLKKFEINPETQIYKKFHKDYKPHITVATGDNNLNSIYENIKNKYEKKLPLKFTINKFWIYSIDKNNEKGTKLIDIVEI